MATTQSSEYREYIGASSAELGYGPETVSSSVIDYRASNGQHVGLFVTEPTHGYDRTIILPEQHDYRNEPLVMRRAEILASQTDSRVALVETPGSVGLVHPAENEHGYSIYESSKRLRGGQAKASQIFGALRGDFSEHAGIQLDAVTDTLELSNADNLVLFGESMGAVTSTEMLRHIGERGLQLDTLVLHEMVNPSKNNSLPWVVSLLGKLTGVENDRRTTYLAENEVIGHPMVAFEQTSAEQKKLDSARKSLGQQAFAGAANGLGMRTGVQPKLLNSLKAFGSEAPRVVLSRGAESTVAEDIEYTVLADALQSNGITPTEWAYSDATGEKELGHSFLMSFGRQALHARQLAMFLEN